MDCWRGPGGEIGPKEVKRQHPALDVTTVEDILRALSSQKAATIRHEINRLKRHLRNYEEFCQCGHARGLHNLKAHTCSDMGAGIGVDCPCPKYRKVPLK